MKNSKVVKILEYTFVITFFIFRCFNLPIATIGVLMLVGEESRGAKYLLVPIAVLQFYWMHLIVKSTISRIYGRDNDNYDVKSKKAIKSE